jgi:hypothetical protein
MRVTVAGKVTAAEARVIVGAVVAFAEQEVEKALPVDEGFAILLKPSDTMALPIEGPQTVL